ncbi:MAG: Ornithine carbamoyltransferase, partial [uncultured Nocardioidaceae bacterium]
DHDPALPAGRRPLPGRATGGPRPRAGAQAGGGPSAVRRPARRPSRRRDGLRQADAAHPGVLRGGHRRARRPPAARGRQAGGHRHARVRRGHRPRAEPAGRRHRVADLRPGPHRGDGGGRRRGRHPGRQRADRRLPPLPAPRRPADGPRAPGGARRTDAGLPGRRRLQHGALLPARRRDRRHARPGLRPRRLPARPGRAVPGAGGRRRHRRVGVGRAGPRRGGHRCRRGGDRHLGLDGQGGRGRGARGAVPPVRRRPRPPRARRPRRPGPALPAGLPRQGDRRGGHRRTPQRRLGRGGEPAARAEGAAVLAARPRGVV